MQLPQIPDFEYGRIETPLNSGVFLVDQDLSIRVLLFPTQWC